MVRIRILTVLLNQEKLFVEKTTKTKQQVNTCKQELTCRETETVEMKISTMITGTEIMIETEEGEEQTIITTEEEMKTGEEETMITSGEEMTSEEEETMETTEEEMKTGVEEITKTTEENGRMKETEEVVETMKGEEEMEVH